MLFFLTYLKISKGFSAKYSQNNKERLQRKYHEKYRSLSKEVKEKKQQYACEQYKNRPENEKQKVVEYRKQCYKMEKTSYYNYKKLFSFRKPTVILKGNDLESSFNEK